MPSSSQPSPTASRYRIVFNAHSEYFVEWLVCDRWLTVDGPSTRDQSHEYLDGREADYGVLRRTHDRPMRAT